MTIEHLVAIQSVGLILFIYLCIYVIYLMIQLYRTGIRKLFSSDKHRRDMFNFIYNSVRKDPASWKIDVMEWQAASRYDMNRKGLMIIFDDNKLADENYKSGSSHKSGVTGYVNMSLEERIRMKSAYRFLRNWVKNRVENESIDKFYIESSGFNDL